MFKHHLTGSVFFVFILSAYGCIKEIAAPIRHSIPVLVVEGSITTEPAPYTIQLSYTGSFTTSEIDSNQIFIDDAVVVIYDENGDSTVCNRTFPGTYQSSDLGFVGQVGHTYTIRIHLANGKTYVSKPETILPVSPIDSVSIVYDSSTIYDVRPNQFIVSVHSHDPVSSQNYYRWTASGYVARKSWGFPCNPYGSPPCTDPYMCKCYALCEQYVEDNQINVLSDKLVNGREITREVFYSPIYWYGKHFLAIKQYSLNKDAYYFWQQYIAQTTRTGSILDPLPSSLLGNIYNEVDSNDIALGLFSASEVFIKKVIIIPYSYQEYWLRSTATEFIKQGDCHVAYPNSLRDLEEPSGWQNADTIEFR